jgi:hypothetical protein
LVGPASEAQFVVDNTPGSIDPTKPAQDVLPGSLKRRFPSEYLGYSLNDIKESLQTATGATKTKLQSAKKILEQAPRLMGD